jgi:hypothetical protein
VEGNPALAAGCAVVIKPAGDHHADNPDPGGIAKERLPTAAQRGHRPPVGRRTALPGTATSMW